MKKKTDLVMSTVVTVVVILVVCAAAALLVLLKRGKTNDIVPGSSDSPGSSVSESSSQPESSQSSEESSSSEPESSEPVKQPEKLDITAPGTYEDEEDLLDVKISADNVVLKNKNIDGSLIIDVRNSRETLVLENLNITGDITMNNLNSSIIMKNVHTDGVITFNEFGGFNADFDSVSAKEFKLRSIRGEIPPEITITGDTGFEKALIFSGAKIVQKNLTSGAKGYNHIGIGGWKPRLWHDISIKGVKNCYLTVNFPANVKLDGNTSLVEAYAYKPCHIYGEGSVKNLYVKAPDVSYNKVTGKVANMDGYKGIKGGKIINREVLFGNSDKLPETGNSVKPDAQQSKPSGYVPPDFAKPEDDGLLEKPELPR